MQNAIITADIINRTQIHAAYFSKPRTSHTDYSFSSKTRSTAYILTDFFHNFLVVTIDITTNLNYILLVTKKVTTCTQKKIFRGEL